MSPTAAQRLLRDDPRTAEVGAREVALPLPKAKALLRTLRSGEHVLALYHQGLGYAALTDGALILLSGEEPSRIARPPVVLRPAYGAASRVDLAVDGRRITVWGSRIDPGGELLAARGEPVPAGSSADPRGGARVLEWAHRRPVLACMLAATVLATAWGVGHDASARAGADRSVAVRDFKGTALTTAVADARRQSWMSVTTADATSSFRPVTDTRPGWKVCFQTPSAQEKVRPAVRALTLYAVPEKEACPTSLLAPRRVVMPDLRGESYRAASGTLDDLGFTYTAAWHAHTGERLGGGTGDLEDWRVCRQRPEPDREVTPSTRADLWLIGPDDSCAKPSPKPSPKPKPKPKPKPEPKPKPRAGGTSGSTTTGGTSGGSGGGGSTGGSSGGSSGTSGGSTGSTGSTGGGSGIGFGQYCSPVGATATTADGRPAKCFMGRDGRARWGYNSG
ncbi:hypothetical protein ACFRIC_02645 [Streptomyces sp. NPDC056738]|uniref:hypothetical protein n=1 Tax=Streptomyces sp. NPDC056738 TaxID=3345933 RepID=UPI003690773B